MVEHVVEVDKAIGHKFEGVVVDLLISVVEGEAVESSSILFKLHHVDDLLPEEGGNLSTPLARHLLRLPLHVSALVRQNLTSQVVEALLLVSLAPNHSCHMLCFFVWYSHQQEVSLRELLNFNRFRN